VDSVGDAPAVSSRIAQDFYDLNGKLFRDPETTEVVMPAKSKAQQMAAGAALSAKHGERKVGELKGASKSMYESMTEKQLHDFAHTPQKGKPKHK
jgi:hypothetical protein